MSDLQSGIEVYTVVAGHYDETRELATFLSQDVAEEYAARFNYGDFDKEDNYYSKERIGNQNYYEAYVARNTFHVDKEPEWEDERVIVELPYRYFRLGAYCNENGRMQRTRVAVPKGFNLKVTPIPKEEGKFLVLGKDEETIKIYITSKIEEYNNSLKSLSKGLKVIDKT